MHIPQRKKVDHQENSGLTNPIAPLNDNLSTTTNHSSKTPLLGNGQPERQSSQDISTVTVATRDRSHTTTTQGSLETKSHQPRKHKRELIDITNPKSIFFCIADCNNSQSFLSNRNHNNSSRRSSSESLTVSEESSDDFLMGVLKIMLEYHTKNKNIDYIDACTVSLSPVFPKKRGNICMYAICQNNVRALKLLLNYSLTVDVFSFSMVQMVVNSIYAIQQDKKGHVKETTEMLTFLEEEFGRNIVYEYLNRKQSVSLETPLHVACAIGDVNLVRLLLDHGAAPSIRMTDFLNQTPLHVALGHCDRPENVLDIVQCLLNYSSSPVFSSHAEKRVLSSYILKAPAQFRDQLNTLLRMKDDSIVLRDEVSLNRQHSDTYRSLRKRINTLGPRHLLHRIKNHRHERAHA